MTTLDSAVRRNAAMAFVHRFADSEAEVGRLSTLLGATALSRPSAPRQPVADVLRDDYLAAWLELSLTVAADAPMRASARYAERREIGRMVAKRRAYEPLPDLWRALVRRLDCGQIPDEIFRSFLVELGIEASACAAATLLATSPAEQRFRVFGERIAVLFGEPRADCGAPDAPIRRIMDRMEQLLDVPEPVDPELCRALLEALDQESSRLGAEEATARAIGRPVSGLRRRSAYYLARRLVSTMLQTESSGLSAAVSHASPALALLLAPKPLTIGLQHPKTAARLRTFADAALERTPALVRLMKEHS